MIKSVKSFKKYVKQLCAINWIGIDRKKQTYYIRAFNRIREMHAFKKSYAVVFDCLKDTKNISQFVQACVIAKKVEKMRKGRRAKIIKVAGRSALQKESALQELARDGKISPYVGLANSIIAKELNVAKSQADRLKRRFSQFGYLKFIPKHKEICCSSKPDFALIRYSHPDRRCRVRKLAKKGEVTYVFEERVYDEVLSCIPFRRQRLHAKRLKRRRSEG
jgi:hypothetical protein